jgi:hypothetical protein
MYSKRHNLIIGFHGCDESVRDKIVRGEERQRISTNDYDWLGHGMYFWEYNYTRALEYAKLIHKYPKRSNAIIKKPSVLGAIIDLGECLDLLDTAYLNLVKESYFLLKESAQKAGFELPKNMPIENENDLLIRKLDCAVIESVHYYSKEKGKVFDSVRSVFFEGDCLYENAGFKEKNHIQICVRNPNCIKGYFIPRDHIENWDE